MESVPDPGLLPIAQAPPARHAAAAAQLLGKHLPGDAGLEHEDDARQGGTVGNTRTATLGLGRFGWKEGSDDGPQVVADQGFAHPPGLPCSHQVLIGTLSTTPICAHWIGSPAARPCRRRATFEPMLEDPVVSLRPALQPLLSHMD